MRAISWTSTSLLIGFMALVAVESIPVVGAVVIVLGGAVVGFILPYVILITALVELASGASSRRKAFVPLLAWCSYYVGYIQQSWDADQSNAQLHASNPGKLMDFDPSRYALVDENASTLVAKYVVPVVYAPDRQRNGSYQAYRLIRCPVSINPLRGDLKISHTDDADYCVRETDENPTHPVVTLVRDGNSKYNAGQTPASEEKIQVSADGTNLGSFTVAHRSRLLFLPVFNAGVFLEHDGGGYVGAFQHTELTIDGYSADWEDRTKPLATVLGLHPSTPTDLQRLAAQNADFAQGR